MDEEFNRPALNRAIWSVYDAPTAASHHQRGNVAMATDGVDHYAQIRTVVNPATGAWSTGGMCACGVNAYKQLYGKYEMRVRASAGNSRVVVLLWPTVRGAWPPEIDWYEMGGFGPTGARQLSTQTVHYGTRAQNFMIHTNHSADMTRWHRVGVEWGPGYVRYLLDGVVTDIVVTTAVSHQPMQLGMQTNREKSVAPSGRVNLDVDWVHMWAYTGGRGTAPAAPANVTTRAGDTAATVSWTAPAGTGNSLLSSYTIKASPGGATRTVHLVSPAEPATTATLTGLTPGVGYRFTVTATGPFGTSAASAASSEVVPTGIPPAVTAGPTVVPARYGTVGMTPATATLPVTITYASAPGSSAICSFGLQDSRDGRTWARVAFQRWAPMAVKIGLSAGPHRFRAQAIGCNGLASAWRYGPALDYRLVQENDASITYPGGTWNPVTCAQCSGGRAKSTTGSGASARVSVANAYQVGIVATAGPAQGAVRISVDGGPPMTAYSHSATSKGRQLIFTVVWPSPGAHTLTLINTASSGHPRFDLDGVVVLGAAQG